MLLDRTSGPHRLLPQHDEGACDEQFVKNADFEVVFWLKFMFGLGGKHGGGHVSTVLPKTTKWH